MDDLTVINLQENSLRVLKKIRKVLEPNRTVAANR